MVILAIMVVATVISGAMIYYNQGGSSPAVGIGSSSGSGLSGALSNPEMTNFTSTLGGLSGLLSNSTLSSLTASLLSSSTLSNLTAVLGGQVAVAGSSLPAADFTATGTNSTFTCSAYPSAAYLALTDNGTGSASVDSLTIASVGGAVAAFDPSGACDIGASSSGAATTYIVFPATSQLSPSPLSGTYYAGVVSLSDGAQIPFEGVWQ